MKSKRPISSLDWQLTPKSVRDYVVYLEHLVARHDESIAQLAELMQQQGKRIEELEARLNKNSGNSSKPPSSDPPFQGPTRSQKSKKGGKKRGGQKGHKGSRQALMAPTRTMDVMPDQCSCGSHHLEPCQSAPYYTHQVVELPEILMDITHYRLFSTTCRDCGSKVKGRIPPGSETGYGPRFSALVAQLSGVCGESRETVRDFAQSVLGVPISTGGVQRIVDRASQAMDPVYEAIAREARNAPINHVDETSWKNQAKLKWLWVMANRKVAFFMIHKNRSQKAFEQLVDAWEGILVSDDYRLYRNWVHERQSCLAHHIRRAKGLAERKNPELAWFGTRLLTELSLIVQWAYQTPTMGEWRAFIARFKGLLNKHRERKDEAGIFARRLIREMESLWLCLSEPGVEPTNNRAERALRYGVIWRKRSLGTQSDKGDRWVERILSLKHTCRMHDIPVYPRLVRILSDHLNHQPTDLAWISNLA